jgi:hypothetical protein
VKAFFGRSASTDYVLEILDVAERAELHVTLIANDQTIPKNNFKRENRFYFAESKSIENVGLNMRDEYSNDGINTVLSEFHFFRSATSLSTCRRKRVSIFVLKRPLSFGFKPNETTY